MGIGIKNDGGTMKTLYLIVLICSVGVLCGGALYWRYVHMAGQIDTRIAQKVEERWQKDPVDVKDRPQLRPVVETHIEEKESEKPARVEATLAVKNQEKKSVKKPEKKIEVRGTNLVKNSFFNVGMSAWGFWKNGGENKDHFTVLNEGKTKYIRIENPDAWLIGMKQNVSVVSGGVYRLRGKVRSRITNHDKVFGGRIAAYLPDKTEHELVWMTHKSRWYEKSSCFTNYQDGFATVYFHMGYGKVHATGDFAEVRLEKLE